MKSILFLAFVLSLSSQVYSIETVSIRLNHDTASAHSASGVSTIFDVGNPKSFKVSLGFSANNIKSELDLTRLGRKTIYPVYGFVKFAVNYPISPEFEFGFDLGDALIEDITDFFYGPSDINDRAVDSYYSLGLTTNIRNNIAASLYYKKQNINYKDPFNSTMIKVGLEMTGVSLSYSF